MKRMATLLFLLTALFVLSSSADAAPTRPPQTLREMISKIRAGGSITVPQEWDGEYTYSDSTYDCLGNFMDETSSGLDTLCRGQAVYGDGTFDCTGSATANTIDVTCTSSFTFDPCTVTYTFTLRATKSGNDVYAVSTLNIDYSGADPTCDLFPDSCEQTNTVLTRIGPAPTAYCATPSRRSSWGELKTIYR